MVLVGKYEMPKNRADEFRSNDDLRSLVAELVDTDPSCIGWTDCDGNSWCDTLKWKLEILSRQKWDWWPFKPPRRRLHRGEARLHWKCVSSNPLNHHIAKLALISQRSAGSNDGQKSLQVLREQ